MPLNDGELTRTELDALLRTYPQLTGTFDEHVAHAQARKMGWAIVAEFDGSDCARFLTDWLNEAGLVRWPEPPGEGG